MDNSLIINNATLHKKWDLSIWFHGVFKALDAEFSQQYNEKIQTGHFKYKSFVKLKIK